MREHDDLDLLLDSALKTYAESEANLNLEQRILARIAAEPSIALRPRWLPWAVALPLAACLLLFALFMSQKTSVEPTARLSHAPSSPLEALPAAPHPEHVHHTQALSHPKPARPVQLAGRDVSLPKLDVFPTPQPLTAEERTLAAIANETPVPLRKALIEAQSHPDAPLHVAAIRIPPIQPPDQVRP
jgi:hypothetical protein